MLALLAFVWGDCVVIDQKAWTESEKAQFHGCLSTGVAQDVYFDLVQVEMSCKSGTQYISFPKEAVSKCPKR
jgi:hypothetical protein